jgi:uncharacterized protein
MIMESADSVLNRHMELIIFPTEACNFRCTYCYEDHAKNNGMRPDVVKGIKNLMTARAQDLTGLMMHWFGGEPLLRYDIIFDIMHHAQKLQAMNGFNLDSEATTNGYMLTPERLKGLVSAGVGSYQITLDGPKEIHDQSRIKTNGLGSFDKIWGNIIDARNTKLDFSIKIRIHVTEKNKDDVRLLLRNISEEIGNDSRFSVFPRLLSRLGSPNDKNLPISSDLEDIPEYATSLGLKVLGKVEDYICYASKPFTYAIRADGSVAKCTVMLRDDKNMLGKLNPDGTMELDARKAIFWSRGFISGAKEELECPAKVKNRSR